MGGFRREVEPLLAGEDGWGRKTFLPNLSLDKLSLTSRPSIPPPRPKEIWAECPYPFYNYHHSARACHFEIISQKLPITYSTSSSVRRVCSPQPLATMSNNRFIYQIFHLPQKHQAKYHKNTKQNTTKTPNHLVNSFIFITFAPKNTELCQCTIYHA